MPLPLADLTGVGENATDIVLRLAEFPARDGKTDAVSRQIHLGGQVATAVVAVARWGLRTRYVGAVGSDPHAELHRAELRALGVESHLAQVVGTESRLSYILVEQPAGSRAVLCHRDPRLRIQKSYLKKAWFQRTRLLHVDGEYAEVSRLAASWAREAGVPVMCDLDVFREDLRLLLAHVDFPVLSVGILEPLTGSRDPLAALPHIHAKHNSRMVCTTMGERGTLAWDGQRFWYAPAFRVKVADTTGAGDLFHAGFAYGTLQGWDTQHMLEFGCAAAGLNCTANGARGGISSPRAIERLCAGKMCHSSQYSGKVLERAAERALKRIGRAAATKG